MIPIGAYTDAQMGMGWEDLVVRYQLDKATAKGIVWRQHSSSMTIARCGIENTTEPHPHPLRLLRLPMRGRVNSKDRPRSALATKLNALR